MLAIRKSRVRRCRRIYNLLFIYVVQHQSLQAAPIINEQLKI